MIRFNPGGIACVSRVRHYKTLARRRSSSRCDHANISNVLCRRRRRRQCPHTYLKHVGYSHFARFQLRVLDTTRYGRIGLVLTVSTMSPSFQPGASSHFRTQCVGARVCAASSAKVHVEDNARAFAATHSRAHSTRILSTIPSPPGDRIANLINSSASSSRCRGCRSLGESRGRHRHTHTHIDTRTHSKQ